MGPSTAAEDLGQRDLIGRPGEHVAAADAALRPYEAGALHREQDLLEVRLGQVRALGDLLDRRRTRRSRGARARAGRGPRSRPAWTPSPPPWSRTRGGGVGPTLAACASSSRSGPSTTGLGDPRRPGARRGPARVVAAGAGPRRVGGRAARPRRSGMGGVGDPSRPAADVAGVRGVDRSPRWCRRRRRARSRRSPRVSRPRSTASSATGCWSTAGCSTPLVAELERSEPRPDPFDVQRHAPFLGRNVPVVTKAEFRTTGFTKAHLRDARFYGYTAVSSSSSTCGRSSPPASPSSTRTTRASTRSRHAHGLHDGFYTRELAAVDRLVGDVLDVLPPDAALLVTSDHGQVHVGPGGWLSAAAGRARRGLLG